MGKVTEEKRIYVAVAATIQVPADGLGNSNPPFRHRKTRTVLQPYGRQIAQACHVVSKLRHSKLPVLTELPEAGGEFAFEPITTIILQARDSAELAHVFAFLHRRKLSPIFFSDDNPEYGPGSWPTALAVFASKKQITGILDYLPLWGS